MKDADYIAMLSLLYSFAIRLSMTEEALEHSMEREMKLLERMRREEA